MRKKKLRLLLTAGATSLALLTAPLSAFAEGGGGSGSGSGYSVHGRGNLHYVFYDEISNNAPKQGTMQSSIDYFTSGKLTGGVSLANEGDDVLRSAIYNACTTALQRAEARNPQPDGKSRVVGLFWGSMKDTWFGYAQILPSEVTDFYNQWRAAGAPDVLNQEQAHGSDGYARYLSYIEQGKNEAIQDMNAQSVAACIALNSNEPPQNYQLSVTTDKATTFTMAGETTPVTDTIHASANGSAIRENLTATVSLIWDSPEGQAKKKADKTVTIQNSGDTTSPEFTPADFGWSSWAAGNFWFDVNVAKQGKMQAAVNTPDRDPRETWTATPKVPDKELYKQGSDTVLGTDVLASAQAYDAHITAHSNGYLSSMTISDTIHTADVWIGSKDADNKDKVYVLAPAGNKIPATVTIDRTTNDVTVSATLTSLENQGNYTLVVPTYTKPTGVDYTIKDTGKVCYTKELKECMTTDEKQTQKVTPKPDKVWVLDETGALAAQDKNWTNNVAADQKLFLHGDKVGAVVNGRIPAKLTAPLDEYVITDDWTDAQTYVNFTDGTKVRVYANGNDVTKDFTITVKDGITTATAKDTFLKSTSGLLVDMPIKLILTGEFKPVTPETDTDGEILVLHNKGSERYNNEEKPTNIPPVFIWTPDPSKDVLSSAKQDGDQSSIDGQQVFPNQWIEYLVNVDVNFPKTKDELAHPIKLFQVKDDYDPNFQLDKTSIEFYDARTNKAISKKNYTLSFDEENTAFTATFTQDWIDSQLILEEQGDLLLRFDGTISPTVEAGTVIANQAFEIINDSITETNIPKVTIPTPEPDKEDLNTDLIDIDKKTVVGGETIMYRLTMDATPARDQLAYDVHKLGMVDDYDEEYLTLHEDKITVVEKDTGKDVTNAFNIQVKDGVAYVFAKLVDTINQNGETIKATQPESLKEYADAAIDPINDPVIDQNLLGKQYWVYLPTTVSKVTDGYVIENTTIQNMENMLLKTRIVSNPEKEINPEKDVTIEVGGESINGGEVALNSLFNYRLDSSVLPADRADKARSWSIVDDYDETADRFTGNWVAIANRDLYDGTKLIAKAGEQIDGATVIDVAAAEEFKNLTIHDIELTEELSDALGAYSYGEAGVTTSWSSRKVFTQGEQGEDGYGFFIQAAAGYNNPEAEVAASSTGAVRIPDEDVINAYVALQLGINPMQETGLFTVTAKDGVITVTATQKYLDLVNTRMDKEQAFSIYVQMERILPVTVTNTFVETYNDVEREPVPVKTTTPEHPTIDIEKWDTASGKDKGDRDTETDALHIDNKNLTKPIEITYTITNTGDVPLKNITVTDETVKGKGTVEEISCPAVDVLQPSEEMTCTATLTGLQAGLHTNTATVTGESIYTDKQVTDSDDWNAKADQPLAQTGAQLAGMLLGAILLAATGGILLARNKKKTA